MILRGLLFESLMTVSFEQAKRAIDVVISGNNKSIFIRDNINFFITIP